MSNCIFYCRTHVNYDAHVENCHACEDCTLFCSDLDFHRCKKPSQRGGHIDFNKKRIDQSVFKELTRSHRGAMIIFQYIPHQIFQDVETFYTIFNTPLVKLLKEILEIYTSVTVSVKIPIILENPTYNKIHTSYRISEENDLFNKNSINA